MSLNFSCMIESWRTVLLNSVSSPNFHDVSRAYLDKLWKFTQCGLSLLNLLSLSLAPRGTFFFGYSGFPLLVKNQHFQIPIRSRMAVICAWHKIPHIRVIIRRPSVLVSEDFRRLTQIPAGCQRNSEDYRSCPKTVKDVQRQPKISEEKSGNFPRADWIDYFCVFFIFLFHEKPSK